VLRSWRDLGVARLVPKERGDVFVVLCKHSVEALLLYILGVVCSLCSAH
jgi:hypothetical protein